MMSPARSKEMRDLLHLMANQGAALEGYFECAELLLSEERHRVNRSAARISLRRMTAAIVSLRHLVKGEELERELEAGGL